MHYAGLINMYSKAAIWITQKRYLAVSFDCSQSLREETHFSQSVDAARGRAECLFTTRSPVP